MANDNGQDPQRIGILTLHYGFNEGAILQSLALARAAEQACPGAEVRIVDYRPPGRGAQDAADDARKQALSKFANEILPLSASQFSGQHPNNLAAYLNERYDTLLVGSDDVWHVDFVSQMFGLLKTQSHKSGYPFPNPFWPDDKVKARRVSYAASIGTDTNWTCIPEKQKRHMGSVMRSFDALGVRDDRTGAFLRWLDPDLAGRIEWVPDPTFAYDLTQEVEEDKLRELFELLGVDFNRPRVLVIGPDRPELQGTLLNLKSKGYQIVALSFPIHEADVNLAYAPISPLQWAGCFKMFDLCLTESMRGCVFSMVSGVPFIAVDFCEPTMGHKTRLKDLISRCEMDDFYVASHDSKTGVEERLAYLVRMAIKGRWSAAKAEAAVKKFRAVGLDYLTRQLVPAPKGKAQDTAAETETAPLKASAVR